MKTLILMLQLLPAIIQAVRAAEEFIPIGGQGQKKLEFVLGVIEDVYDDAKKIVPLVTKIVARIVSLANATGVFSHQAPAA